MQGQLPRPRIQPDQAHYQRSGEIPRTKRLHRTADRNLGHPQPYHPLDRSRSAVAQTAHFANPMLGSLAKIPSTQKGILLEQLLGVIGQLQRAGIISIQRMCLSCRFYQKNNEGHFCQFLEKPLNNSELRVDCGEFLGGGVKFYSQIFFIAFIFFNSRRAARSAYIFISRWVILFFWLPIT